MFFMRRAAGSFVPQRVPFVGSMLFGFLFIERKITAKERHNNNRR